MVGGSRDDPDGAYSMLGGGGGGERGTGGALTFGQYLSAAYRFLRKQQTEGFVRQVIQSQAEHPEALGE